MRGLLVVLLLAHAAQQDECTPGGKVVAPADSKILTTPYGPNIVVTCDVEHGNLVYTVTASDGGIAVVAGGCPQ